MFLVNVNITVRFLKSMPISPLSLIIGLGKTGLSCARYLQRKNIPFIAIDTRENPPQLSEFKNQFPDIPVFLGALDIQQLSNAKEILVSPGLDLENNFFIEAHKRGIPIIGDIELFAREAKAKIAAITGTNAKGTVTTLVGNMLKAAGKNVRVGGNIGTPALDLLTDSEPDFYVLEISSFQLETTYSLHAAAATILNFSVDHLDRHHTMEAYIAAKQRIYHHCVSAIWNREDNRTQPITDTSSEITFGLTEPRQFEFGLREKENQFWLAFGDEYWLPTQELYIKGRHNWANVLAALAMGHALQIPKEIMLQTLREFKGLTHRCEWVAEKNGVTWYNDSKGTNVGATIAAIEGLGPAISGKIILIAGGLGKGADFSMLQNCVSRYVKTVILIGKDAALIEAALTNHVEIKHAGDMEEAVNLAAKESRLNDIVLLSPACASWDMFRDFEHRGEVFKSLVGLL
jgi:UDP-N-acetylmuramoylalanine--D-glutamate ligase